MVTVWSSDYPIIEQHVDQAALVYTFHLVVGGKSVAQREVTRNELAAPWLREARDWMGRHNAAFLPSSSSKTTAGSLPASDAFMHAVAVIFPDVYVPEVDYDRYRQARARGGGGAASGASSPAGAGTGAREAAPSESEGARSSVGDFYVQPFYGYRTWRIDPGTFHLTALSLRGPWPFYEPLVSEHISPTYGGIVARRYEELKLCQPGVPCSRCGIWAFDSYAGVEEHRSSSLGVSPSLTEARGLVAGWGKVVICQNGWRAGKAYPLALLDWQVSPLRLPGDAIANHYLLHRVARRYGIPVVPTVLDLVRAARARNCVSVHDDPFFDLAGEPDDD